MKTNYSHWLGKQQQLVDTISPIITNRLAVTLDKPSPQVGEALPHLWHWCFFQPALARHLLGGDGHPALGQFLPPADNRNRMWAGGEFVFYQPLIVGEAAQCNAEITEIIEKQGRTGKLLFVTVTHKYFQDDELCFIEKQHIVYREPTPPKTNSEAAPPADWQYLETPDETQLFRYSAVTFNGHRIHYDYTYATEQEGYDNLVIHGPMMATWALHGFMSRYPEKKIKTFNFRGVRPVTLPQQVVVAGTAAGTDSAAVWISNENGLIQRGEVTFY